MKERVLSLNYQDLTRNSSVLPKSGPINSFLWYFLFPSSCNHFESVLNSLAASWFNLFTSFSWPPFGERNKFCTPNQRKCKTTWKSLQAGNQVFGRKESQRKEAGSDSLTTRLKHNWDLDEDKACQFQDGKRGRETSPYQATCAIPDMLAGTAPNTGLEPSE